MDSTLHVSNVTGLVIAIEVPVEQSVHCRQYHSDSNRSRDCVDLLTPTDRLKLTSREWSNYRACLGRARPR